MAAASPFERVLQSELLGDAAHTTLGRDATAAAFPTYGWASFRRPASRGDTETVTPRVRPDVRAERALGGLGLGATASCEDVRRAFRRLARQSHPDCGGSHEAFLALERDYRLALRYAAA